MQAVFTGQKTKYYLALMTGNSREIILSREMVKLVLINAAANHITRSVRCLLNRELGNIKRSHSPRGSVKAARTVRLKDVFSKLRRFCNLNFLSEVEFLG